MAGQVNGMRQYVCTSCGGTVLTIAVLRQLEGDLAEHLWTGAASPGESDARCPFCRRPMEPKATEQGAAATCRLCETVWLDKQAAESIPDQAPSAGTGPTLASQSLKCPQCGAPVANSWDEQCKFCGAAIHAPTQVVLFPTALPGEPEHEWGPWHGPRQQSLYSAILKKMID